MAARLGRCVFFTGTVADGVGPDPHRASGCTHSLTLVGISQTAGGDCPPGVTRQEVADRASDRAAIQSSAGIARAYPNPSRIARSCHPRSGELVNRFCELTSIFRLGSLPAFLFVPGGRRRDNEKAERTRLFTERIRAACRTALGNSDGPSSSNAGSADRHLARRSSRGGRCEAFA